MFRQRYRKYNILDSTKIIKIHQKVCKSKFVIKDFDECLQLIN